MAYFDRTRDFTVKMTKCRLNVHPYVTRNGHPDTPTGPAASCFWDQLLIWAQRGILIGTSFNRFAPDYD